MKFGLIARADDRGLGIQTWEIARHLRPERIIVVQMPSDQSRYVHDDLDRYMSLDIPMMVVPSTHMGDAHLVGAWLDGLDVVYSAETFYDWRFCDIARQHGVRTVLHMNPEFWPSSRPEWPGPDVLWAPTDWLLPHSNIPLVDRIIPMPVAVDRWQPFDDARYDGPLRVLHVNGHNAMADRNGTHVLFHALRRVTKPMIVTVTTQRNSAHKPRVARCVELRNVIGNQRGYWTLYEQQDVLALPRRYGGLCLPANEACGAGLAVVMTDVEPNRHWPIVPVAAQLGAPIDVSIGAIDAYDADYDGLAAQLDALTDRDYLDEQRAASRRWARAHSWEALSATWRSALIEATR